METLLTKFYNEIRKNSRPGEFKELLEAIEKELRIFEQKRLGQYIDKKEGIQKTEIRNPYYYRPSLRGELKYLLQKGVPCEVVASNEEITSIFLKVWLNFDEFTTEKSQNEGWVIYQSSRPEHKRIQITEEEKEQLKNFEK